MARNEKLVLVELHGEAEEMAALQQVFERSPRYFIKVTGQTARPAEAQSSFSVLPEGKSYDDKFVFGVYLGEQMVGTVDVVRGYPQPHQAFIGLLLVADEFRGRGFGRDSFEKLEDIIRAWPKLTTVRIAVVGTNDEVVPFWEKLGFCRTGEVKAYKIYGRETTAIFLEKPCTPCT